MALQPGMFLKSQYRIDALIGGGGMAVVYRAYDYNLQRVCAIKQNMVTDPAAQHQFHLEAITLASLSHPHLVQVLDHFSDISGQQYLVMDFVDGENLDSYVKRTGPAPEGLALAWMAGVLDAVAYCHGQRIIHRDIKPANLVRRRGQDNVVLVDFGIAKQMRGSVTPPGAKAASPAYAPQEQLLGNRTDERSDVYALGATLYFLLTGQEPPSSLQLMIGAQKLSPPRALNPRISPATEKAILRAMSGEMRARPASVADFARLLQAPAPGSRTRRSLRWGWVVVVLALLALLASGALAAPRLIDWLGGRLMAIPVPPVTATTRPVIIVVPSPTSTEKPPVSVPVLSTSEPIATVGAIPVPSSRPARETVSAPATGRSPTSTPVILVSPSIQLAASATPGRAVSEVSPEPTLTFTRQPEPAVQVTLCPPYLHRPLSGKGLLLIENHLGEALHIDNIATGEKWDLPPKQGDVPARLTLDLSPGSHTLVVNTFHGHGRIGVAITAGAAFISPIWYNDRTEELVYPLDIPADCQ